MKYGLPRFTKLQLTNLGSAYVGWVVGTQISSVISIHNFVAEIGL